MAATFLTIAMITYEMLAVLHNMTVAAKKANRTYEKQFARTGAKIGAQVQIRKPPLYTVSDGAAFVGQDYTELMVPLIIDKHKQVGVEFVNDDLTLSMDDFSGRFLKPAVVPMANQVDVDVMANYFLSWNTTGVPGTIAATDTPFLDAKTLLLANAAPDDVPPQIVSLSVSARLSSGLAGRFNPQLPIGELFTRGRMGEALGWDFNQTQNVPTHVTGAWAAQVAGTGLQVNLAGQTGSTINIKGATTGAGVIAQGNKGDTVQFAGVFMNNPITQLNTGLLQNFVLTADNTSDNGGLSTLSISPPLIVGIPGVTKGLTQSASPANNAQVFVWGTATVANVANQTSPQCMGWGKEAVTLACIDLMMPDKGEGVLAQRASDDDLGLSLLYTRQWDSRAFSRISRMDILYGTTFPRPEHVTRVAS